jgi:hypothetical protein
LSRSASRIAAFLARYRGLSRESLTWFHHHSEVDIRHAEEGLQAVVDYLEFYEFDATDVEVILDITFRENVFIKRYFADWSASVPACNERLESAQSARASETLALQSLS